MSLIESIRVQFSQQILTHMSQLIGESEEKTGMAIEAALPSLLSGLLHQSRNTVGAAKITGILGKLNNKAVEAIPGLLASANAQNLADQGHDMLERILGSDDLSRISNEVNSYASLNGEAGPKMLGVLGPLAMGTLKRQLLDENGIAPERVSHFLQSQEQSIADAIPAAFIEQFAREKPPVRQAASPMQSASNLKVVETETAASEQMPDDFHEEVMDAVGEAHQFSDATTSSMPTQAASFGTMNSETFKQADDFAAGFVDEAQNAATDPLPGLKHQGDAAADAFVDTGRGLGQATKGAAVGLAAGAAGLAGQAQSAAGHLGSDLEHGVQNVRSTLSGQISEGQNMIDETSHDAFANLKAELQPESSFKKYRNYLIIALAIAVVVLLILQLL